MDGLIDLKKKYNEALERNKKAEEYLKAHTVEECSKKRKIKGHENKMTIFDLFNEVVIELSLLKLEIERLSYRNMTHDEIINGF